MPDPEAMAAIFPGQAGCFDITLGMHSRHCQVLLDDVDLTHLVRGITIRAGVGNVTTITLEFIPKHVALRGVALVKELEQLEQ
jgi:hypothetical protein